MNRQVIAQHVKQYKHVCHPVHTGEVGRTSCANQGKLRNLFFARVYPSSTSSSCSSRSTCIAGNRSSALFVFSSHKIIISPLYLIEKTVINPVRCMDVLLGSVKPSWGRLCVQVDCLKGIVQRDLTGVETRLKRSVLINFIVAKFAF